MKKPAVPKQDKPVPADSLEQPKQKPEGGYGGTPLPVQPEPVDEGNK